MSIEKYPKIWKVESCLVGECRDERTSHRWSIPLSSAEGLVTECYDCHKTRRVNFSMESHHPGEPSEYVKQRLKELNGSS